ncbi:MAG: UrcA family protein [Steroidobacteraceae bacterium]|jgi:UrcA family protein
MNTFTAYRSATTRTAGALGAIAALLMGASMIPAANAATFDEVPSVVVRYDARSLATESGARELYVRLVAAARHVCPEESTWDLRGTYATRRCREEAVARAVNKIHQPRLVEIAARNAKQG